MDRRKFSAVFFACASQLLYAVRTRAEDMPDKPSTGYLNAVAPTLGGKQFWADELFFHDWHIQRNTLTGHCRLLNGSQLRYAWGSYQECLAKLEQIKQQKQLPRMTGPAVIVLHGLFRNPGSMSGMAKFLRDEGQYTVFNVAYPTTRGTVADHARTLAKVIDSLDGITEINFVCHSLGNLVVRHYLGDHAKPEQGLRPDPRIKRMVMLGPPNRGAKMAEAFAGVDAFHTVAGRSASQLASSWADLESRLATPEFQFGIIAGGRGTEKGYNPWLGADNDMVVSVETTRLPGACDFVVVPALHTLMMDDATVRQYTLRFLQQGCFISPEERNPISRQP